MLPVTLHVDKGGSSPSVTQRGLSIRFGGWPVNHLALTRTRISDSLLPLMPPSPAPVPSHGPTFPASSDELECRPNRSRCCPDHLRSGLRTIQSPGRTRV